MVDDFPQSLRKSHTEDFFKDETETAVNVSAEASSPEAETTSPEADFFADFGSAPAEVGEEGWGNFEDNLVKAGVYIQPDY